MACDKCLDKMAERYQKRLDKLSLKQRLGTKGELLSALYGRLITCVCKHEVSKRFNIGG